jgi:transcriptional regulator with XRE-family HTH domain
MADPRSAQHHALGKIIRARCEALGISQEDLAHEAGMEPLAPRRDRARQEQPRPEV